MADQAITALPKKTNSGSNKIAATDYMLGIDSAEGYQMLIKDLGDYIIQNVQSSLMGSNQTLAAALSALNSNTHILATTLDDLCSKTLALPSSRTVPLFIPATVTSALINVNMVGKGYVSKVSNIVADIVIYSGANGELYSARLNPTTKEVSNVTSIPTRAEVNALNSTISWHAVPSSVTTIALFQNYIDNQITANGYFYGYMTAAVSVNAGLGNIGHFIFAEANSTNYRLVQAVSSDNNNKYSMIKFNGTWRAWIPTKEDNIWFAPRGNEIKTNITTYVENIAAAGNCGLHIFWSSASNYTTVGAPVQSAMYYKVIVMHSETIYIEAYTMGTVQTRKFIKQKYANAWGEWIQVHNQNTTITAHPDITDVLTPAQDVTILHSYVSVRNGLVILDCHFSQTSTTKTDRFTFKTGYKPIVLNTNISPIFMYANNAVSDSVLFVNPTTLTIFGATPVANREYYFRLVYFNE